MNKGRYFSFSIGEALQKLRVFKQKDNTISILQSNWFLISDCMMIHKYSSGTLYVKSSESPIYLAHLEDEIRSKANLILGDERIKKVKIIKRAF